MYKKNKNKERTDYYTRLSILRHTLYLHNSILNYSSVFVVLCLQAGLCDDWFGCLSSYVTIKKNVGAEVVQSSLVCKNMNDLLT